MANLLATLLNSASSLEAYDRVLEVTQNNVANASTPGYAKQTLPLEALAFDPSVGLPGGVRAGEMQNARNEFAEQAVRRQNTALGWQQQSAASLTSLQAIFDISSTTGIPEALNNFFQSISAWGQDPSNTAVRQTVIERAADVAQNFQNAANAVQTLAHDTETQLYSTVDQVNHLVGQIAEYNRVLIQSGFGSKDMGMDAQVHATLEELSPLIEFTATRQDDGTTTILLNGQTPLLIEDRQYSLSAGMVMPDPPTDPNAPPTAQLRAGDGSDITTQTTDGQLGALLDIRNRVLPSFLGDASQAGSLNHMAKEFADKVNEVLTAGTISDGPPPVPGVPLFVYDGVSDTTVSRTLAVDTTLTPDQLAATAPGPPYVSNGVPIALSRLAAPTDNADKIDGVSYSEFYGGMAKNVGNQLQNAQHGEQVQQSLLAQARSQRQQLSGVSLDEEAMILVEFQRAYQANSRFITVLNQLTEEIINILR